MFSVQIDVLKVHLNKNNNHGFTGKSMQIKSIFLRTAEGFASEFFAISFFFVSEVSLAVDFI